MSSHLGLDLSPFALRSCVLSDGRCANLRTLYSPKGCRHSDEYPSSDSWTSPMSFRAHVFGETEEINSVEKTVDYLAPGESRRACLEAYLQTLKDEPSMALQGVQMIGTLPDHASPDDRENLIRSLGGNAKLVWRPIAAALYWLKANRARGESLCGRTMIVLDLDGERPEITPLELKMHECEREDQNERIVPVRTRPTRQHVLRRSNFDAQCYSYVLNGLEEAAQLLGGQFANQIQKKIEEGASEYDAWIRKNGAWRSQHIGFASDMPAGVVNVLSPLFKGLKGEKTIVLCVGWFARRYASQFERTIQDKLGCDEVHVLAADAICTGASEFGRRLEEGLPTYYDQLPKYRWWDGREAEWKELFGQYQCIEPGRTYDFPERGSKPCRLMIPKYNDNVSMYVQVATEDNTYVEDEEFAHRLKINFAEFLRKDAVVQLTASIDPSAGSAKFTLTAEDRLFLNGKSRTNSATLSYSDDPDLQNASVQIVHEHEGYLEAQPVLGRIYDSDENLEMVRLAVEGPTSARYKELEKAYFKKYGPKVKSIVDRVGYDATPREPTRGMFGTKRVPDSRVDAISARYAQKICASVSAPQKMCNYCHAWATEGYRGLIRDLLSRQMTIDNPNLYYAPGYVFEKSEDFKVVMEYFLSTSLGKPWKYAYIFWSIFRMLCWNANVRITEQTFDVGKFFARCKSICAHIAKSWVGKDARTDDDIRDLKKYLLLAILYILRIRESGDTIDQNVQSFVEDLVSRYLPNIGFPRTMINNLNGSRLRPGDTLSAYVLRFVRKEDTLQDRELGAAMGGV